MNVLAMTDWQEAALAKIPGVVAQRIDWVMPQGYGESLLLNGNAKQVALLGAWMPVPSLAQWAFVRQQLESGKELLAPYQGHKTGSIRYNVGMLFAQNTPAVSKLLDSWAAQAVRENPWQAFETALLNHPVHLYPLPGSWWRERFHPGVAVVVPCYRHEQFVESAVRTALEAGADQVIVVDDGSPGNVVEALQELAGQPVYILRQENQGLPAARNAGIQAATCQYVLSLDADDELDNRALKSMRAKAKEMAWAYSDVYLFGEMHKKVTVHIDHDTMQSMQPGHPAVMYTKHQWSFVNGYDPTIRGFESWDFQARLMQAGYEPGKANKGVVRYRKHDGPSMLTGVLKNKQRRLAELRARNKAFFV